MRKLVKKTPAHHELTLPMNLIGLMTTPSYQVEDPIHEIQQYYNTTIEGAIDIYETVGDDYINERIVAALCGVATPSYIAKMKGGQSC